MKKLGMAFLIAGLMTTGSAFADTPKAVALKTCNALVKGDAKTAMSYMKLEAKKEMQGYEKKFKGKLKGLLIKGLKNTDCKNIFLLGKGGGISRFVFGSDLGLMIQQKDGQSHVVILKLLDD